MYVSGHNEYYTKLFEQILNSVEGIFIFPINTGTYVYYNEAKSM